MITNLFMKRLNKILYDEPIYLIWHKDNPLSWIVWEVYHIPDEWRLCDN